MRAGKQVAGRVEALIAERDLGPGDRLPPERQLAKELGVSRSSLREGLRRLLDLGVVRARQGSGTYVADVDLADLMQVRMRLEPYAASLAAARRRDEDLARMDDLLTELRAALSDPAEFGSADVRLHAAVVDAADSAALRILMAALNDMLLHSRATTAIDDAVRHTTLERLQQLVGAIRDGDARGAERAMRTHLKEIGARLQG